MTTWDEKVFSWISNHFYPEEYRFCRDDAAVFRDAVRLAGISHCQRLDAVDYDQYLDYSLYALRKGLNLEPELIQAYYQLEQKRYAHCKESLRLLTSQ